MTLAYPKNAVLFCKLAWAVWYTVSNSEEQSQSFKYFIGFSSRFYKARFVQADRLFAYIAELVSA